MSWFNQADNPLYNRQALIDRSTAIKLRLLQKNPPITFFPEELAALNSGALKELLAPFRGKEGIIFPPPASAATATPAQPFAR